MSIMEYKSYLEEANGFNTSVKILCDTKDSSTLYSIGVLAGHSLELGLKGYLIFKGVTESELKRLGHDIKKLWIKCKEEGLAIEEIPYWIEVLNYSHSQPFYFRYPKESHKVAIPSCDDLAQDLKSVLSIIEGQIK